MRKRTRVRYSKMVKLNALPGARPVVNHKVPKRKSMVRYRYLWYHGKVVCYKTLRSYYPDLSEGALLGKWKSLLPVKKTPSTRIFQGAPLTLGMALSNFEDTASRSTTEAWFMKLPRS